MLTQYCTQHQRLKQSVRDSVASILLSYSAVPEETVLYM